jgi:hypothetical protein
MSNLSGVSKLLSLILNIVDIILYILVYILMLILLSIYIINAIVIIIWVTPTYFKLNVIFMINQHFITIIYDQLFIIILIALIL